MTKTAPRPRATRPDRTLRALSRLFKNLADDHRLKILYLLGKNGELNVGSLGRELGQSQPAVSHHLAQLKRAGLVEFRREGKFNYYALSPDGLGGLFDTLFPAGSPVKVLAGGVEVTFRRK